jgi:geranylgeranyl pyrophosphate synthase
MRGLVNCGRERKWTVGRVFGSAVALLATGFLFAAGYDIYTRLFKKQV